MIPFCSPLRTVSAPSKFYHCPVTIPVSFSCLYTVSALCFLYFYTFKMLSANMKYFFPDSNVGNKQMSVWFWLLFPTYPLLSRLRLHGQWCSVASTSCSSSNSVDVMRDPTEFSTFKLDPITKGTGSDVRMACSGVVMRPLHQLAACPAPTLEILTETLGSVKMVL